MPPAIILAAGFSRRLGRPKQTVMLSGETLLARAVRIATAAQLSPIIVIVPTADWSDSIKSLDALVLVNPEAAEGISSSIRVGIAHAQELEAPGAVLMTCDQSAITPEHLRALTSQPTATPASAYGGKLGISAYFPAATFARLLKLTGDKGARELLHTTRSIRAEALTLDIDTEADLTLAQRLFSPPETAENAITHLTTAKVSPCGSRDEDGNGPATPQGQDADIQCCNIAAKSWESMPCTQLQRIGKK